MILGIGTDIIEIDRVSKAIKKNSFLCRYFTEKERAYLELGRKQEKAAGIFAAKEAFVKALGSGFRGVNPIDIEVLPNEKGKPVIQFYHSTILVKEEWTVNVAISHCRQYATAFCVIEA